jgi:hypothetical protein
MKKLISASLFLFIFQFGLLSLHARSPGELSPDEQVRRPPEHHICQAVNNQYTLKIIRQVVEDDTLKFQEQEFEPILLGKDAGGRLILVGKAPGSDRVERIPLRYIKDSAVDETKTFLVTQQMRDHAAGMVSEIICGP